MARRRHGGSDSRRYYDWLDRAGEDMIVAEILMKDDRCYDSCLFHCQQAIEKALKGFLLLRTGNAMDGHNLTWLCKQAMNYERKFYHWLDESASLNSCYIAARYPTDLPHEVEEKDVNAAFDMAKDMYIFICEKVDEELDRRERQSQRDKAEHAREEQEQEDRREKRMPPYYNYRRPKKKKKR